MLKSFLYRGIILLILVIFSNNIIAQSDITNLADGVITSQHNDSPSDENISKLIDNSSGTKYLTFHSNGWVQFYTPIAYVVNKYTFTSANDSPERDPSKWTLSASNDLSSWVTLDSRSNESFSDRFQTKEYMFNNSSEYKYFRFILNSKSGNILQLSELELFTLMLEHDVSVTNISSQVKSMNTPVIPKISVSNFGANTESFSVTCIIKKENGSEVYNQSMNVGNLTSGNTRTISFPQFIPTEDVTYTITAETELNSDLMPDNDSKTVRTNTHKKVYIVGYSHLDLQWNWTMGTTINEYLPNTLLGNFKLFEKYPDYRFSFEGAYRYMIIKKNYPDDYAKLKQYIADEKWYVAGSMVEAVDVIVPSPESLMRQILYGNGFFKEEFGKTSVDILLPDCFGFAYSLPTIAVHCGLKGFSTQKFDRWGGSFPTPFSIGQWEGVDGSRITAVMKPGAYDDNATIRENDLNELGDETGLYVAYDYYGKRGDIGGPPDESQVTNFLSLMNNSGTSEIEVIAASSDQIFRDLTESQISNLPVYNGEFLMTLHGSGCYTSHADLKLLNRKNELTANSAERVSVMAELFAGKPYPKSELTENWIKFIAHAFHDDLTGTSIQPAYDYYSIPDYEEALEYFENTETEANNSLSSKLDTRVDDSNSIPVVVYNPLAVSRTDAVETTVKFSGDLPANVKVFNKNGDEVPSQIIDKYGDKITVMFMAAVPSVGHEVYYVKKSSVPCAIETGLNVNNEILENDRYTVTIDDWGDVSSIYDKLNDRELFDSPSKFELRDNKSARFPAWEIYYNDVVSPPRSYVEQSVYKTVLDSGAAQVSIKVTRSNEGSNFTHIYSLNAQDDGFLKVENIVNWKPNNPNGSLLKVSFPLSVSNINTTYDLGLGTIKRGLNTAQLYEVPGQQWADITENDNSYGVSILNDCKYGWDKPWDNIIQLTLIHSPVGGNYTYQGDKYVHNFTYGIYGHTGNWAEGLVVPAAERLNQPLMAFQTNSHAGELGKSISFVSADPSKISVMALKKSEDESGYIVRVRESAGKSSSNVKLTFATGIVSSEETNGMEETVGGVSTDANSISFDLTPYQPKTFLVKLNNTLTTSVNNGNETYLKEFRLNAPYPNPSNNSVIISFSLPIQDNVKIKIYDQLGQEVRTLESNSEFAAGDHKVAWNHTNDQGRILASGIYFIRVETSKNVAMKKIVVLK
ncbi:MAG: T9SS type A sorting domain-containing protein [Melioribacteraceae bacterium]|nr:T9SS type A sorting domain-containing protein [Melioribacteraceae bacterium]